MHMEIEPQSIDRASFLAAMRAPMNAVAVVATAGPGKARNGMTVTAVCSLSDSPPSLLVCLNRQTGTLPAIIANGCFSVNFLSGKQTGIARLFGGAGDLRGEDRFDRKCWLEGQTGAPILEDCLASFDCRLVGEVAQSTHVIVIGEVVDAVADMSLSPLVYGRRTFKEIDVEAP